MFLRRSSCLVGALGLAGMIASVFAIHGDDAPPGAPKNVEVLARGPVHEAYAEPAEVRPEPGPVVAKQPPDPIQELAPDQKPEGDNVVWIPGYFAWDDEASNF